MEPYYLGEDDGCSLDERSDSPYGPLVVNRPVGLLLDH